MDSKKPGTNGNGRRSRYEFLIPDIPPRSNADDLLDDFAERLKNLPPIRKDLVSRLRKEIKEGTYETEERMDKTIERLLDDLL